MDGRPIRGHGTHRRCPATLAAGTYSNIMTGLFNSAGRLTSTPGSGVVPDNQTRYQIGTLTTFNRGNPVVATINSATPSAVSRTRWRFVYLYHQLVGQAHVGRLKYSSTSRLTQGQHNAFRKRRPLPATPTTQWTGGPYADTARTVTIPATLAAGTYNIAAGLFNSAGRLTLTSGSGVVSDNQAVTKSAHSPFNRERDQWCDHQYRDPFRRFQDPLAVRLPIPPAGQAGPRRSPMKYSSLH